MSKRAFLNLHNPSQLENHDVVLKKAFDDIHLNSSGVSHHEDNNTKLTNIDSKITIGQDVKVAGSSLQQILMYGRHFDGTLHPLETTTNDRLLVDVAELTNVGRITTSSSLPAIQICGHHLTDGKFKSISVDGNGQLELSPLSHRSSEVSIINNSVISASAQIGGDIDISDKKSILIYGSATGNHNFNLEHSMDNTNFFLHSEITPVHHGATYHYNVKIEEGLRYYRLVNSNNSNTFTLNYISL